MLHSDRQRNALAMTVKKTKVKTATLLQVNIGII